MSAIPEAQAAVLDIVLSIPSTDNAWVDEDLADVALKLTPQQAAKLVPRICQWVQGPIKPHLPDKIGDLGMNGLAMEVHFEDGVFAGFRLGPLLSEVVGIREFDHQLSHVRRARTMQIAGADESKCDLLRRSGERPGGEPRDVTIRRQGTKVCDQ